MTRMKARTILAVLAVMAAMPATMAQIRVSVDGQYVNFEDQQPVQRAGRVLVPLRGVFEEMGATVTWNPETRTVFARRGNQRVRLHIGSSLATVNGSETTLDVPPMI